MACFYPLNYPADTLSIDFFFETEFVHAWQCTLKDDVLGAQFLRIAYQELMASLLSVVWIGCLARMVGLL